MQKPKVSKNHLYIAAAVGMALVASFIAVSYVQNTVAERTQDTREMIEVAVPMADLPQGAIVQSGDLASRSVPVEFAPADAITPDNHAQYEGRVLRAAARGGAPLSASALVPLHEHFSSLIPRGKVAYTLSVDENNSISGMIVPGDMIDILFVKDKDNDDKAGGGVRVLPLLEQVRVLATGTKIGEEVPREGQPDTSGQGFSSVTLELGQDQAKSLAIASQVGSVRVLLREVKDRTAAPLRGLSEQEWLRQLGLTSGTPAASRTRESRVEFIIGGRG